MKYIISFPALAIVIAAYLLLAAGDALAVDFTGTLTSATGVVTVCLVPA